METWLAILNKWGLVALLPCVLAAIAGFFWYGLWPMVTKTQTKLIETFEAASKKRNEECAEREEKLDRQIDGRDKVLAGFAERLGDIAVVLASIDSGVKRVEGRLDR